VVIAASVTVVVIGEQTARWRNEEWSRGRGGEKNGKKGEERGRGL